MFYLIVVGLVSVISCSSKCSLTKAEPQKASPSLYFCSQNNDNSCCSSQHDNQIGAQLLYDSASKSSSTGLFTYPCTKLFAEITLYFCFGCDPNQMNFINTTSQQISVCKSFVQALWGADINQSTTRFDQCGMWYGASGAQSYVLPSAQWSNAQTFLNNNIPANFPSTYTILIVDDFSNPYASCYKFAHQIKLSFIFILFLSLLF